MIFNAFVLALRAIRRNLLRSFLTILGIVIGVASVIVMVTLGNGATAQVTQQISSMGSNMLMVRAGQRMGPGQRSVAPPFEMDDVEAIREEVGGIVTATPASTGATVAIFGNQNWSTTVTGTDNRYFIVRDWKVEPGREFSASELMAGKAVCILGETVRKELFGAQDPIGSDIRLKNLSCRVVGVMESKGQSSMGQDRDDAILMPIRTYWRRIAGDRNVDTILISAQDGVDTEKVARETKRLLRERRRIGPNDDDDFFVMDMKEIIKTVTGTTKVLTALLGAVAAVSLLVGGIGIMNIMLVSVTERTKEIGTRLAIGALERDVLLQFLVESVVLSSLGGIIGILLALGGSLLLADALELPFIFDGFIVAVAFLFSMGVGVIFGYFPARKAARLDPIEALRHE